MGLDSVELQVNIEEHFDIVIPDNVAVNIITVGDIVDAVVNMITLYPGEKCKSQLMFYNLRNYFCERFEIPVNTFTPYLVLADFLPFEERKFIWKSIEADLRLKLTSLNDLDKYEHVSQQISFFGFKLYSREKPITQGNIRELIENIFSLNHTQLLDPFEIVSKSEVGAIVRGIISESQGIDIDEIRLESLIGNDLGIS